MTGLACAATAAPNCPVRAGMRRHSVRPRCAASVARKRPPPRNPQPCQKPSPRPVTPTLCLASGYKTHPRAHERAAPGRTTQIVHYRTPILPLHQANPSPCANPLRLRAEGGTKPTQDAVSHASAAGAALVHQRPEVVDRLGARRHGTTQLSRACGHAPPQRAVARRSTSCANDRCHARSCRATLSLAVTLSLPSPYP